MIELVKREDGSYTCPTDPGEPELRTPRVSVTDTEAEQIAKWVSGMRVVEFGTGLGVSTRAMAKKAKSVTTTDPDPWVVNNVAADLGSGVVFIQGQDLISQIDPAPFDAAFIDACHQKVAVERDVREAIRLLKPDGFIILHDWNAPEVQEGAAAAGFVPFSVLTTTHGLAIGRRP